MFWSFVPNPSYFFSDLLSGAGVETALPLAPACRRSPAQPVITLAVTVNTITADSHRPPHSQPSLARSSAAISAVLSLWLRKSVAKKQSGRPFLQIALSLVRPGKHCNSTAVKAGCRTCGMGTGLRGGCLGPAARGHNRSTSLVKLCVQLCFCSVVFPTTF